MYHAVTDFTNQNTVVAEIIRRITEDTARQLQTIAAGSQTQYRLMTIFPRQIGHIFDKVVLHFRQIAEQVGTNRRDLMDQAVRFNVLLGNGQRVNGDIHRIHFRFRERVSAGDRNTAAAGAHIQNVLRLMVNQAGEVIIDKLTDRRTRHQHTLVHEKFMAAEPGFIGQIGNRNTFVDSANHALNDAVFFAGSQTRGVHILRNIQRQVERWQYQLQRLIPRVVRAMAVPDIRRAETTDRPTQHVLNGMQLIDRFINKNFIHAILQDTLYCKFGG